MIQASTCNNQRTREYMYRNDGFLSTFVLCDYPSLRGWYFCVLFNVQRTRSQRRDGVMFELISRLT